MWLISTTGYSYLNKFTGLTIGIPLFPFMGFVGYYVLGYYLANSVSRIEEKGIIIFGILGLALTVIGTRLICGKSNGPNEYYFEYLNISVISASAMIFLIIKNTVKRQYSKKNEDASNLTFGIYLVHPIILGVLDKLGVSAIKLGTFIGIPVTVILTLIISGVLVYLLRLVKITKIIVP
jgi:surface polysaccharide O-acyltransferase-like enzyme